MDCGDTFLMPAPGGVATPHLWIVVTQPDPQTHLCAIVSVTTLRNSKDQTVILRLGDHPFGNNILDIPSAGGLRLWWSDRLGVDRFRIGWLLSKYFWRDRASKDALVSYHENNMFFEVIWRLGS